MSASNTRIERELDLQRVIETLLPEFADACRREGATELVMSQHAFAVDYQDEEFALLGRAVKYAGFSGKNLTIHCGRDQDPEAAGKAVIFTRLSPRQA
jgi:hypothetical protein